MKKQAAFVSSSSAALADTPANKRIVLAYSGGLDTSTCLRWFIDEGYEVIAFCADLGQVEESFDAIKEKALAVGAKACYIEDIKEEFVEDYVWKGLKANALYEGRYLLGTALARPIISKKLVEIAQKENCGFVSHGSTGKGNDQVRFELSVYALDPTIQCVTPWRIPEFYNRFQGRQDLLEYAKEKGIPVATNAGDKPPYSCDENIFHISYESGILEDPAAEAPAEMFTKSASPETASPDGPATIAISFKRGIPQSVTNEDDGTVVENDAVGLLQYLNQIGGEHAIGRIDIVENRFVGIKSRGVYECPGGTILKEAHVDLEALTMDREVMHLRDELSLKFAKLCYNGFWFAPEMDFVNNAIDFSQRFVNGEVRIQLYKGNVTILSRSSPTSLYDMDTASMDVAGGFDVSQSEGFIKTLSRRLVAYKALERRSDC